MKNACQMLGVLFVGAWVSSCGGSVENGPASATGGAGGTGAGGGSGAGATAGHSGTGAVGGAAGMAGAKNSGDCDSDSDCGGGECVELTPGGYRVCRMAVQEATQCQNPDTPGADECCNSSDCSKGKCYAFPATPYCGGAYPMPHNVCASDSCQPFASNMCPVGNETSGVCVPSGVWGYDVAGCKLSNCLKDTECNAEPGGLCLPIEDPCCASPKGLYCEYPSDGCRKQSDCGANRSCVVEYDPVRQQNIAHCKDGVIGCPA